MIRRQTVDLQIGNHILRRVGAALALTCGLMIFLIFSGGYLNQNLTIAHVAEDYSSHVESNVHLTGDVVSSAPVIIRVSTGNGILKLQLEGVDLSLSSGDRVRVYGTILNDHTILVHNIVIHQYRNLMYMYTVSLGGAFLSVVAIVRHWKIDYDQFALVPKGDK